MNRIIKFRAWNKTDGHMVASDEINNPFIYRDSQHHILEQFTGLHDKTGKEIYEGDIIKPQREEGKGTDYVPDVRAVIVWDQSYKETPGFKACPIASYNQGETWDHYLWWLGKPDQYVEVIGNIHENKELLK